jgi:glycosyltransferase involved in cell wall biosynthesis
MSILLSALTRYHVFDLALQLKHHGLIDGLVTAYPKSKLGRYEELKSAVISLPQFALARKASLAIERFAGPVHASRVHEMVYARFSQAVARASRHRNAGVVYGLSGYMKEFLYSPQSQGKVTIVDHGSLHIETEKRILKQECARFGFAEFGNWQHEWLVQRMRDEFQAADYVVCCSNLARETMVEHQIEEKKLVVHRLGVNLSEFTRQPDRQRRSNDRTRLLFVGAMTPLKGLHYLLEVFPKLRGDTELWLVGVLPSDPVLGKMIDDCRKKTGRVQVIGPVPQADLNRIYNQCDVFVLPSLSDGWGMVVSQALACGLPIVVSDMTGAKELVEPGQNGFVVKSGDPVDLEEKLTQALDLCVRGNWQNGLQAADSSIADNSWVDYGNGWSKWLGQLCA